MRGKKDLLYDYWRQVVTRRGQERETFMVVVKCTIAATAAWVLGVVVGTPRWGSRPSPRC